MAFVKLDCGILNSTIWCDRAAREVFLTALLMAEPDEVQEPVQTLKIRNLELDDFVVPPGWYGFVPSSSLGVIHLARLSPEEGMAALERLAAPDAESRSREWDGRRMVRVNGGFIILNFDQFRNKDHTTAERSARYRQRKRAEKSGQSAYGEESHAVTGARHAVTTRGVTQAEAEAEAEAEAKKDNNTNTRKRGPKGEVINGVDPRIQQVILGLRDLWPKKQPDGSRINAATGLWVGSLRRLFEQNPALDADMLVAGAKIYLEESLKAYKAPQYYFGPNGYWLEYANLAFERKQACGGAE